MNTEQSSDLARRAAVHAALADPARLLITDTLAERRRVPLGARRRCSAMPSNLLAHHLHVLEEAGLITRHRSEGDRRRTYLRLVPGALDSLAGPRGAAARRVLFVCTANSARSHLAAALWRQASAVPAASAGTHPAAAIDPGAVAAARRHQLPLPRLRPRHIDDVWQDGDLVVTVCDLAHEELGGLAALHWSVPDPVPPATRPASTRPWTSWASGSGTSRPASCPLSARRRLSVGERDPPRVLGRPDRARRAGRTERSAGTVRMKALDLR